MVSAGVSYGRKGRLHFIDEKAKVNVISYYVESLFPSLVADCNRLLGSRQKTTDIDTIRATTK